MSEVFSTLGVAMSGMNVYRTWLDVVADNVANVNTVTATNQAAVRERFLVVSPAEADDGRPAGARVEAILLGADEGYLVSEPGNPLADANGMVRRPSIDLAEQMVHLQLAQRGYQANVRSFESAKTAYETLLSIGR